MSRPVGTTVLQVVAHLGVLGEPGWGGLIPDPTEPRPRPPGCRACAAAPPHPRPGRLTGLGAAYLPRSDTLDGPTTRQSA